ncbi:MAG: undecaprenyl-phosphate glucose phosphotransferase [Planctomycetales bacterium]|nr:undecaprenyl-phosphate glucose phosphotransferase [Planctomycetales bacterium]
MTLPSRHIHQHISFGSSLLRLADAASVAGGLLLALQFLGVKGSGYALHGAVAVIVHYLVAEFSGMYRSWRGASPERQIFGSLLGWSGSFAILAAIGFATGRLAEFPRSLLALWLVFTPLLAVASHTLLRQVCRALWSRGINTRRFAIVGMNELGFQLARNIEESPELGLKLAGFYDDRPEDRNPSLPAGLKTRVGGIDDLVADSKAGFVSRIYITFPMRAEDRIRGVLAKLADSTASVYIVPDFFVFQLLHSRWTDIGGLPAVSVFENPLYGVDGVVKRLFDLVVGGLTLATVSVPMLLIALAIKLTSRGPIFFRQLRYGLDGKEILVWKFRSMRVLENGEKVTQATQGDPRITRLGVILRKTSLDELPQLFNVLEGSMSLVGPRPHATAHNEQYRALIDGYMLRHKIKPGITGLAQVRGFRGETDTLDKMQKRVESDHEYIREWSIWMDATILFRTIFVVLKRENAY